ncbi:hypothetical protein BSKO_09521 [Bryopsis sp. KO-2023]|nr:hypothetical protein BSKO_09521 [Bryopsis sp. KO-2023]
MATVHFLTKLNPRDFFLIEFRPSFPAVPRLIKPRVECGGKRPSQRARTEALLSKCESQPHTQGMRVVHFKVGEVSEATTKEDFIIAEENDSASDTFDCEGEGYSFESLLDTDYFGSSTFSTEESCWQGADEVSSISALSERELSCQNCAEPRDGLICDICSHNANEDPCAFLSRCPSPCGVSKINSQRQDVLLAYDDRMNLHAKGAGRPHPERPDRLTAVMSRLLSSGLAERCRRIPCREATCEELNKVHSQELINHNRELSSSATVLGEGQSLSVSSDLYVNDHTFMCSRLAAGGSAEAAGAVARKEASAAAAIIRPPGHHAESSTSMGFCFFNNAAVAARVAQDNGAERVLIVDWDVHHGNGTQQIFEDDPSVLYVSMHRHDRGGFYPGTGAASSVGRGAGEGYSVNIPWDCEGMGDEDYLASMEHIVLPIANEFDPHLIIISAGFDAAEGDPLGGCKVTCDGYAHLTRLLSEVAPLVVLLEGGYNLKSTALSTEACLRVLLGEQPAPRCRPAQPSPMGWHAIQETLRIQCQYWSCLSLPSDSCEQWVERPSKDAGSFGERFSQAESTGCLTGVIRTSSLPAPSSSSMDEAPLLTKGCGLRRHSSKDLRWRKFGRCSKSDLKWRHLVSAHENALKTKWNKRRKELARQGSLGSSREGSFMSELGSGMELEESISMSSTTSSGTCTPHDPPNSVIHRAMSRLGNQKLHRF